MTKNVRYTLDQDGFLIVDKDETLSVLNNPTDGGELHELLAQKIQMIASKAFVDAHKGAKSTFEQGFNGIERVDSVVKKEELA